MTDLPSPPARLAALLGVRYPLIQAPLAGVQDSALALEGLDGLEGLLGLGVGTGTSPPSSSPPQAASIIAVKAAAH